MKNTTYNKESNNEIILDPKKVIMSKTNYKGILQFANNYFVQISGYSYAELINKPHNIIRHPDMPKIIFKVMWEKLHKGENLYAVVKNLTKNGDYYWVVTKFETTFDEKGNILAHYARRKAVPNKVRETTEAIYKTILEIEKIDEKLAEEAFYEILDEYNLTYDQLFLEIADMNKKEVDDYFLDQKQNINTQNSDIIQEIDINHIDLNKIQEEEKLKSQEIKAGKTSNKDGAGFLGNSNELQNVLSKLRKNLKS